MKQFPPKLFLPGRARHVRPPAPERSPPGVTLPQLQRQRDARHVIQEGGEGAQAELRASHGSAERGAGGDRGSAQEHAQGAGHGTRRREQGRSSGGGQSAGSGRRNSGQGAGKGPGHGKGAQGRGQGAQEQGAGRGALGERAGQGVGDGGRDPRHGQGAGKGPKGKGKGAANPKGQAGRGIRARGGGRAEGRGAGSAAPPQPDVQLVRCIPSGIQQMPAHHTHHHHHINHHLYNIDPDAGELVPPQPPRPQHQPAPPAPRAEPARMASAEGGRGVASAPQAQGQRGEPARGAEGARPWDRDWGAVPDPLGGEVLPLVGEVYGWLCWANQGTTRGLRDGPFDAVLLRRDGGKREVPPGGWAAPEDHERVLRSVIRAAWPDREPTWPAFLEGGAVLRITDADANNWLRRALRSALAHWRYRGRNPPPPQPQPRRAPKKRRPRSPPEEAAAPGVRGHHGRGRRPHGLPAAGRRRTGGAHDRANGAALSEAGPGKTGARTRAGGFSPPPPPPYLRRTDPSAADQTAPNACGRPATPTARVYPGGARRGQQKAGRRPTGRGGGPPTPPPRTPPRLGSHRSGPPPPRSRGDAPPPEGTATRGGGMLLDLLRRGSRPQGRPTPACRSNARTRTVWGPRPT